MGGVETRDVSAQPMVERKPSRDAGDLGEEHGSPISGFPDIDDVPVALPFSRAIVNPCIGS